MLRDCPVVGLLVMAIAHATAHTIIRVKTSDDAIVMQRSIRLETILCQYSDEYVSLILLEQRRKHRASTIDT